VYGGAPPAAFRVTEYGKPTVAGVKVGAVVMVNGCAVICSVNVADTFAPLLSETLMAKEKIPAAVGIPEIWPPEDKVRPGGSVPDWRLHV